MMYFITIVRNVILSKWVYKFDFFLGIMESWIELLVHLLVWMSLFATVNGQVVKGYSLSDLITYTIVSRIAGMIANTKFSLNFADSIKTGDISLNLIVPYSTRLIFIAKSLGNSCVNLLTVGLPLLLTSALFESYIQPPISKIHFIFFLISLFGALMICITFELLSGVLAFWKVPGDFIEWYFSIFFVLLSGSIVPLWFFPSWLNELAKLLPFQAVFFIPAQIYMGRFNVDGIIWALFTQLGWVLVLFILHDILWRRGIRNLTILGG